MSVGKALVKLMDAHDKIDSTLPLKSREDHLDACIDEFDSELEETIARAARRAKYLPAGAGPG